MKLELEMDESGAITAIKKTDDCFYSRFDVESKTMYLEDLKSTYSSVYTEKDSLRHEDQHLSSWFKWQREESPSLARTYTDTSEILEYFVPGSIAAFYIFVIMLALT